MIRHIANTIPVHIIPLILIPIIIIKLIKHNRTVGGDIKTVSMKIIMMKIIIITTGLYFYSPAIVFKRILLYLHPAGTFHIDTSRIFQKGIVGDIAIRNIF